MTAHQPGGAVVVRDADGNDLQAVLAVGRRTWPATYGPIAGEDFVAMGLAKWWTPDALIPAIRSGRVLVAEVAGDVVGMAAYGPDGGDLVLWKLYVLPGHQGRGLGSALLAASLERSRGLYERVRICRLDGNDTAARFYARHGFVEVARDAGYGGLPDSVWMSRPLDAGRGTSHDAHPDMTPAREDS